MNDMLVAGLLVFSAPISYDFGNSCQTFKLLSNTQPSPAPEDNNEEVKLPVSWFCSCISPLQAPRSL
jgi:hypothetical protein